MKGGEGKVSPRRRGGRLGAERRRYEGGLDRRQEVSPSFLRPGQYPELQWADAFPRTVVGGYLNTATDSFPYIAAIFVPTAIPTATVSPWKEAKLSSLITVQTKEEPSLVRELSARVTEGIRREFAMKMCRGLNTRETTQASIAM